MGEPDPIKHTIVVSPNNSLTPRGAVIFFSIVAISCLTVALGFTGLGFWPVLPFAGLEIFALGLCLGLSLRRGNYREVITITGDTIEVQSGIGSGTQTVEFQRHWSYVEMCKPGSAHHPYRLMIRSGVRSCEVASCLTETERNGLWKRLSELIGRVDHSPSLM